jgi:iron(III) transport system ATP-binding protein
VTLRVPAGSQTVLLGPSGCGKTTLLRIIAGLEREDRGVVAVDGERLSCDGRGLPPEKRRIGMVFQDWGLFPHMTVERNVAFGLSREQIAAGAVARTLDMMRMTKLASRRPHELSAGQAQRVALARALAPQPRLLLFDEPFSSLDAELRVRVRTEVAQLMRELAMTAVYVTHDQEEAFVLGDEIAVMAAGGIVQQGTPERIYLEPASAWVAGMLGEANLIRGDAAGSVAHTRFGQVPLSQPRSGDCRVLARPEHLAIAAGDQATVTAVEFYGHDTVYRLTTAADEPILLVRAGAAPLHQVGDRVSLAYTGPAAASFAATD